MARFRAFVQKRLARETASKSGFVARRRYPSLERKPIKAKPKQALKETIEPKKQENIPEENRELEQVLQSTSGDESRNDDDQAKEVSTISTAVSNENGIASTPQTTSTSGEGRDDDELIFDLVVSVEEELRENPDSITDASSKSNTASGGSSSDADESIGLVFDDDESTVITIQDSVSSSLMMDSNLAIVRSKEEMQKDSASGEEQMTQANYSYTTGGSDASEMPSLPSLTKFLNMFQCAEEESLDKETNVTTAVEQAAQATISRFGTPRRFFMAGDSPVTSYKSEEGVDVSNHIRGRDPTIANVQEEISSAFSSPSRRSFRSFKVNSRSSDQEVDQVIEIVTSDPGMVDTRDGVDFNDFWEPLEASSNTHMTTEDPSDVVLESIHSEPFANVTLPAQSLAHLCGREPPVILRDQQTMLPDNLPPMARLRYCSHIGGRYSLLVTKERCYV